MDFRLKHRSRLLLDPDPKAYHSMSEMSGRPAPSMSSTAFAKRVWVKPLLSCKSLIADRGWIHRRERPRTFRERVLIDDQRKPHQRSWFMVCKLHECRAATRGLIGHTPRFIRSCGCAGSRDSEQATFSLISPEIYVCDFPKSSH